MHKQILNFELHVYGFFYKLVFVKRASAGIVRRPTRYNTPPVVFNNLTLSEVSNVEILNQIKLHERTSVKRAGNTPRGLKTWRPSFVE